MIRRTTTRIGARGGRRAGIVLGIGSLLALSVGTGTLHAQAAAPTATTTTLTSAPTSSTGGQSVVLTAAIVPVGTVLPTGTVLFKDGTTTLGTSPVTAGTPSPDGTATLTTAFMAAATHALTAAYSGDTTNATSTGTKNQVVTVGPATKIGVTANPASIPANQTTSALTATIEDAGGNTVTTTPNVALNFSTTGGTLTSTQETTSSGVTSADTLTRSASTTGTTDTVTVSGTNLTSGTALVSEVGTNTNFVNAAYTTMLGHAADPSGLNYWVAQLNAGLPRTSFAGALATTSEYRNNVISGSGVNDFYHLYLKRAGEAGGIQYWVNRMAGIGGSQLTFEQVRLQFVGSPEFFSSPLVGNNDRSTAIEALYQDLLNRASDPAGKAYWMANFDVSKISAQFLFSSEGRSFLVDTLYHQILSRTAVGDPGMAFWTNALLNGASDENIIASILGSVEYYNAHH